MNRVVIVVGIHNDNDEKRVVLRVEEPAELADLGSSTLDLSCDNPVFRALDQPDGDGSVLTAGKLIFDAITKNEAVAKALDLVSAVAAGGSLPVLLRVTPGNPADDLPWEALYMPKDDAFVGLQTRSPMARMTGHAHNEPELVPLAGPVTILAVLAAHDRDADPEWQGIYQAAVDSGLAFHITVLCSKPDLCDEIAALDDPRVSAELVPAEEDLLLKRLTRARPHLLHVFCHAYADGGYLEIDTPQAADPDVGGGQLYIDAKAFADAARNSWLAVLNACEGAEPTAEGRSFAYAITSEGVPASIGMRREIDAEDAHRFAHAFYGAALGHIAQMIAGDGPRPLDWADAVRSARTQMLPEGKPPVPAAKNAAEWTLPVLYLRPGSLQVWSTAAAGIDPATARERASELRELERTRIPDDASPEFRNLVLARIDELRTQLGGDR